MKLSLAALLLLPLAACFQQGDGDGVNLCGSPSIENLASGVSCDGAKYASDCASVGLPSKYGVDSRCERPLWHVDKECLGRPDGTSGCTRLNSRILCCP